MATVAMTTTVRNDWKFWLITVCSPCCCCKNDCQLCKLQNIIHQKCQHFPSLPFFTDYCWRPTTAPITATTGKHVCLHICDSDTIALISRPLACNTGWWKCPVSAWLLLHFQETAVKNICLTLEPSPAQTTQATTTAPPTVPGSSEYNMTKKSSCLLHSWSEQMTTPSLGITNTPCNGMKILYCFCLSFLKDWRTAALVTMLLFTMDPMLVHRFWANCAAKTWPPSTLHPTT